MLKNIEYIEINKSKVMLSTLFVPLAAPIFLIFLTLFRDAGTDHIFFGEMVGVFFLSLLYGVIFWLPTIIVILLLEFVFIRKSTNETGVCIVLFIEGVIAFVSIWGLFGFSFRLDMELPFALGLSIILPQMFRWIYLKRRNRMFNSAKTTTIDQL
ncbi:MAG: hypothetical protein ABJG68_10985 [Crocinitomicaceae bacterium]